jgi:hypothetical protein
MAIANSENAKVIDTIDFKLKEADEYQKKLNLN